VSNEELDLNSLMRLGERFPNGLLTNLEVEAVSSSYGSELGLYVDGGFIDSASQPSGFVRLGSYGGIDLGPYGRMVTLRVNGGMQIGMVRATVLVRDYDGINETQTVTLNLRIQNGSIDLRNYFNSRQYAGMQVREVETIVYAPVYPAQLRLSVGGNQTYSQGVDRIARIYRIQLPVSVSIDSGWPILLQINGDAVIQSVKLRLSR
jgi:hypothetical protein